jgi:hypothetical protein
MILEKLFYYIQIHFTISWTLIYKSFQLCNKSLLPHPSAIKTTHNHTQKMQWPMLSTNYFFIELSPKNIYSYEIYMHSSIRTLGRAIKFKCKYCVDFSSTIWITIPIFKNLYLLFNLWISVLHSIKALAATYMHSDTDLEGNEGKE